VLVGLGAVLLHWEVVLVGDLNGQLPEVRHGVMKLSMMALRCGFEAVGDAKLKMLVKRRWKVKIHKQWLSQLVVAK
jgi:hypothetical protein